VFFALKFTTIKKGIHKFRVFAKVRYTIVTVHELRFIREVLSDNEIYMKYGTKIEPDPKMLGLKYADPDEKNKHFRPRKRSDLDLKTKINSFGTFFK
jgi:hypothetical protein